MLLACLMVSMTQVRAHFSLRYAAFCRKHVLRLVFLENVKNLKSHDKGNTYKVIMDTFKEELGYTVYYEVIDAVAYVPQHEREFILLGLGISLFLFSSIPGEGKTGF